MAIDIFLYVYFCICFQTKTTCSCSVNCNSTIIHFFPYEGKGKIQIKLDDVYKHIHCIYKGCTALEIL